jgi:hypothetical protein
MAIKPKTHLKQFAIGGLFAALGAGTFVIAATTFSDFTTGTTISSSEMNAKLNALKDAVNGRVCPANTPNRFTDQGDDTICDSQTGLMWEMKTGTVSAFVSCVLPTDCPVAQDVNNSYFWTGSAQGADGQLFTDFLARINRESVSTDGVSVVKAGYTDWRIPNIVELRSILRTPCPGVGAPCIDAAFGPTGLAYWASSSGPNPITAWSVNFSNGSVNSFNKLNFGLSRAVRGGR